MESPSEHYLTIQAKASTEYKDRGSRFIAYANPASTTEHCKAIMKELKAEHPKANHHCFAFRLGIDHNTFRASDDGEPNGTAGRPILGQIDSRGLTNILVAVVRYFGGTLLGVPGLIQAYKTSASLVLQLTPAVRKNVMVKYDLQFNYTILNEVMSLIRQYNCEMSNLQQELFCQLSVFAPKRLAEDFESRLKEIFGLEFSKAALPDRNP